LNTVNLAAIGKGEEKGKGEGMVQ